MFKRIYIALFVLLSVEAYSQQISQYTQYTFNKFGINPAVAGTKECIDTRLGYRKQWWGFEGAPVTTFANINARITPKRSRGNFHGVGVMIEADATGPTSRTIFNFAYAYHMMLSPTVKASVGLYAGFQQYRFDAAYVTLNDYSDNAIQGSGSSFIIPDISPGVWLYSDEFYFGVSARQVVQNNIKDWGTDETKLVYHLNITGGKKFELDDYWSFIPSVTLKYAPTSTPALDLTALFDYRNTLQLGAAYRNVDALSALVKVKFFKFFSLGYAFDFTTSKIRHGTSLYTHEIMLGIYACPSKVSTKHCSAYD